MDRRTFLKVVGTTVGLLGIGHFMGVLGPQPEDKPISRIEEKIKGEWWGLWWYDKLLKNKTRRAEKEKLRHISGFANCIGIHSTANIDSRTLDICARPGNRYLEQFVEEMIGYCTEELGLSVLYAPHLDFDNVVLLNRGDLKFETKAEAESWFRQYRAFISKHAKIAQKTAADMFSIGCELYRTLKWEQEWDNVINDVKEFYRGPIIFAGIKIMAPGKDFIFGSKPYVREQPEIEHIFYKTEYICPHFYFPLGTLDDISISIMEADLGKYLELFEQLSKQYDKQILVTEIGLKNFVGANLYPWFWQNPNLERSDETQANYLAATIPNLLKQDFIKGVVHWNSTCGYNVIGLPAEKVLRRAYSIESKLII